MSIFDIGNHDIGNHDIGNHDSGCQSLTLATMTLTIMTLATMIPDVNIPNHSQTLVLAIRQDGQDGGMVYIYIYSSRYLFLELQYMGIRLDEIRGEIYYWFGVQKCHFLDIKKGHFLSLLGPPRTRSKVGRFLSKMVVFCHFLVPRPLLRTLIGETCWTSHFLSLFWYMSKVGRFLSLFGHPKKVTFWTSKNITFWTSFLGLPECMKEKVPAAHSGCTTHHGERVFNDCQWATW